MSGLSSQDSVDNLYLEDDIVWSDDPNRAYFASVLERKVLKRMATGKRGDDSLVGNSTQEEIMGIPSSLEDHWLQMKQSAPPEPEIENPVDFPRLFDVKSTTTKSGPTEQENPEAPVLPTSPVAATSMEPQPPEFIFFQHCGQAGYKPPPGVIDPKYIQARQRRRRQIRILFVLLCLLFVGALATVIVSVAKKARETDASASALRSPYTPAPSPIYTSQGMTKKPLRTTPAPTFSPSSNGSDANGAPPLSPTIVPTAAINAETATPSTSATSESPATPTIPPSTSSTSTAPATPTIAPTAKVGKGDPLQDTQAPTSSSTSSTPSLRPTQLVTVSPSPPPSIATITTPEPSVTLETKTPTQFPTPATSDPTSSPTPAPSATTPAPTVAATLSLLEQAKSFILKSSPDSATALSDTSSPQYKAVEWLSSDPYFIRRSNPKSLYRWALATLYYSTAGSKWTNSDSWLSGADECDWYSTTSGNQKCNGAGFLADLGLNDNNLKGTIPPELSLFSNNFVRFDLGNNTLGGSIPTELGRLYGLVSLQLSGNRLTGSLPTEIGNMRSLIFLELNNNKLNGGLPSELGNLVNLEYLSFFKNQFHGSIPATYGQLAALKILDLDYNKITGTMPTELGELNNLQNLNAISNNMTGSVPDAVCSLGLSKLEVDCTSMDCTCCTNCESYTTVTTQGGTTTWWHHWTYYGSPSSSASSNNNRN